MDGQFSFETVSLLNQKPLKRKYFDLSTAGFRGLLQGIILKLRKDITYEALKKKEYLERKKWKKN